MVTLGVDTGSPLASAAIVVGDQIVAQLGFVAQRQLSTRLMGLLEEALAAANLRLQDIHLLAVARGPGSFTGVRIGVSTVKGIALASDLPVVGVSSLLAVAATADDADARSILALAPSRRNHVYLAAYSPSPGLESLIDPCHVACVEVAPLIQTLPQPIALAGSGWSDWRETVRGLDVLDLQRDRQPLAGAAALIAAAQWRQRPVDQRRTLRCQYVVLSQAERPAANR